MNTITRLSDADSRREQIIESAILVFAKSGYGSTPVSAVAMRAGISQAYVFKLYPTKEMLFVAAMERCYDLIVDALAQAADTATTQTPTAILDAMGEGYARLIADKSILMIQVHAQSACDIAAIRAVVRRGMSKVTEFTQTRSGGSDEAVQSFLAFGQLCHLIVTTGITGLDDNWAKLLTRGIRHHD